MVERNSLRDQVRAMILQRIGRGNYPPGQRIVESALAEELGISTVPVREAIRELVAMRVLDFALHKGAWVREVSVRETIESLQVRSALEPLAARLGGRRLARHCPVLKAVCKAILAAARRRDFIAFQEHNQKFHRTIVEASDNAVLIQLWSSLAFEVRTRFILDYLETEDPVGIAREHEPIVAAFETGDSERGAVLLANHSRNLVHYLEQQNVPV